MEARALIIIGLGLLSISCGSGPLVDTCLSYPEKGGFICVDRQQNPYFLAYAQTGKYVAFSPDDAQKLITACGINQKSADGIVGQYQKILEGVSNGNTPVLKKETGN